MDWGQHGAEASGTGAASMRQATGLDRIVLRSPNGSALAWMLRERGVLVLGAAPRNRRAAADWIARWLTGRPGQAVAVIAAGSAGPTARSGRRLRISGVRAR